MRGVHPLRFLHRRTRRVPVFRTSSASIRAKTAIVGYDAYERCTPPLHGEATDGRDEDGAFGRIANASFGAGLSRQAGGGGNAAADHRNRVQGAERREHAAVELYAVRGQTMERLRSVVRAAFENGGSAPQSPGLAKPAPEVYSERRRGLYREADPYLQRAGRSGEFIPEGSYRFFGAPAAVLVYVHEDLLPLRLICCGAFMTQLALAAHAEGLGTCAIGFVRTADRQMREVLSVPVDEVCRFFD